MRFLTLSFLALFLFSCSSNSTEAETTTSTRTLAYQYGEKMKVTRTEEEASYEYIGQPFELKLSYNEHSKDSHGEERVIKLHDNLLTVSSKSWGHTKTEPIEAEIRLSEAQIVKLHTLMHALELDDELETYFPKEGSILHAATLTYGVEKVIHLQGGETFTSNKIATNMEVLVQALENLAQGDEQLFAVLLQKYIQD